MATVTRPRTPDRARDRGSAGGGQEPAAGRDRSFGTSAARAAGPRPSAGDRAIRDGRTAPVGAADARRRIARGALAAAGRVRWRGAAVDRRGGGPAARAVGSRQPPAAATSPPSGRSRFDAWVTALDALSQRTHRPGWSRTCTGRGATCSPSSTTRAGRPRAHGRLVVATARPSLLESAPEWAAAHRHGPRPAAADRCGRAGPRAARRRPPRRARGRGGGAFGRQPAVHRGAAPDVGKRREHSSARTAHGAWRCNPGAISLPPTVQAIYAAQLDDLPPDARQMARRGAVAGGACRSPPSHARDRRPPRGPRCPPTPSVSGRAVR